MSGQANDADVKAEMIAAELRAQSALVRKLQNFGFQRRVPHAVFGGGHCVQRFGGSKLDRL